MAGPLLALVVWHGLRRSRPDGHARASSNSARFPVRRPAPGCTPARCCGNGVRSSGRASTRPGRCWPGSSAGMAMEQAELGLTLVIWLRLPAGVPHGVTYPDPALFLAVAASAVLRDELGQILPAQP